MATRIAFATHDGFPNLTDDDRLAVEALKKHSIKVDSALWDDPAVNWSKYSAVIIRSCWDYHLKPDEFRSWLDKLQNEHVVLWNPFNVIRWNMDKTYLNDLHKKGIPVLASVWLTGGENISLHDLMLQNGWNQAVVKPLISAAANDTETFTLDSALIRQKSFETLLQKGGVIVQDFAQEIQTDGEWSLIFFNKQYSHSVVKRPQNGDFRVQRDFGGTAHPAEAPLRLIDQAQSILDGIQDELLYARVDGIDRGGQLFLMELELIEPHLFFEMHSQAAARFADALIEKLSTKV
jgi:glutathione synthase/RimK-type ligase-like ATP-grasp enzyme